MPSNQLRGALVCGYLVAACSGTSVSADASHDVVSDVAATDSGAHTDSGMPDSTVFDTGLSDVPLGDVPGDVPPVSPCGSALFCEPFDSYAAMTLTNGQHFGPWRAALQTPGSTMVLDGIHTVSGPRALHVHIDDMATAGGRLFSNGTLPILAGNPTHIYGRMMMYIEPNGSSVHWTFFGVSGPAVAGTPVAGRTATYLISSLPRSNVNTYSFVDGLAAAGTDPYHDCWDQGMTPMPSAQWTCVSFDMDSVARRMRLSIDNGASPIVSVDDHGQGCVGTVPGTSPWYGPAINQFYAGAWSFHPMVGALDVWVDDLVLDTSPVSCPTH